MKSVMQISWNTPLRVVYWNRWTQERIIVSIILMGIQLKIAQSGKTRLKSQSNWDNWESMFSGEELGGHGETQEGEVEEVEMQHGEEEMYSGEKIIQNG